MRIKVVIADTSFSSRKGLSVLIRENRNFEYVAAAADIKTLTVALQKQAADVLIIHYCCDDCFSLDVIKKIKIQYPNLKILVISHEKSPDEIKKIIDIGIKNYILQDCSGKEITQAIDACAQGKIFFPSKIVDVLLERDFTKTTLPATALSQREIEILQRIAEGLTGKEIAEKLFLSIHTVHTHRKNISKKLHIRSTAELVLYAIRFGLISLGK